MKDPEEDVPPPDDDLQEQEEDEQEDDEISEDIPSSGLDAVLNPNGDTNMMWQEYLTKQKTPLPVFDGFIAAELSAEPIPFHFVRTDAMEWDPQQAHAMAMNSARIACDSADIFRGRTKPARIERRMTPTCLKRLENASQLLVGQSSKIRLRGHVAHRCRTNVLQHGVRTNGNSLEMRIF